MGVSFSSNENIIKTNVETLCFSLESFDNNITKNFHKIIEEIEEIFELNLDELYKNKIKRDDILLSHFRRNKILLEIKIVKYDAEDCKECTQIIIKMLVKKYDNQNKQKFIELYEKCIKIFCEE
jgi:hypothetical protein